MGGKSIAARASAFKQRHSHVKFESRLSNETNIVVNVKQIICIKCGHKWWFKTERCPECNGLQN